MVGGTGMLAGVTLHLAAGGLTVSVVARRERTLARLTRLASGLPGHVHPLEVDWHDGAALRSALDAARAQNGPFDLVVAWVHSSASEAPFVVADAATEGRFGEPLAYYQLFGTYDQPGAAVRDRWRQQLAHDPRLEYHEIHLGHEKTSHGPRWLTNEEISAGVIEAIEVAAPAYPIGDVDGVEKPRRAGWLASIFKR